MKQVNRVKPPLGLVSVVLFLSSLASAQSQAAGNMVELEIKGRNEGLFEFELVEVGDEGVTVVERRGRVQIERHLLRSQVGYIHFKETPYCPIASGHIKEQRYAEAFARWEYLWSVWRTGATSGWVDPNWMAAWWDVIQLSKEKRNPVDTLLLAETFSEWFATNSEYRLRLDQLIAECLIDLDQYSSALTYLEAIFSATFPEPSADLFRLSFQIYSRNGDFPAALNAWLNSCVLTGSCMSDELLLILDQWETQTEWRDLKKPSFIKFYDTCTSELNDPS